MKSYINEIRRDGSWLVLTVKVWIGEADGEEVAKKFHIGKAEIEQEAEE